MHWQSYVSVALLAVVACGTAPDSVRGQNDRPRWSAPPLERATSVRVGRTGEQITLKRMLDQLAKADVVFLGETHDDETTHRVELAVYEALLARRDGRVVLAMEMFERDVQPALDAYLAGELNEATFLKRARPWRNYRTAYRPLIERAKREKLPVVASNFPRPLRRQVAREGAQALQALKGSTKTHVPDKLLPNSPAYWRRVDNAVRGHQGMMAAAEGDPQRLYSTQSLWDNAMGDACAKALDQYPDNLVLHINGAFHSAYWDGTVHQLRLRKPKARVKTVSIVPVPNPAVAELEGAPSADYVIFAESRAGDINDGAWSVYVQREFKYRFHLPKGASSAAPVPLLIWLSDDGLMATDGLELWKQRLGDQVAIAVIEAPYRELQPDFSEGGRWFWPDSFASDIGSLIEAVERTWGYLLRQYPIDATRVSLAGEGTGATVVAAVALLTQRMDIAAIALSPRQYAKLRDFSLPLPESWGDDAAPQRSLRVLGSKSDQRWWEAELKSYAEIGMEAQMVPQTANVWESELQAENAMRDALALDHRSMSAAKTRRYILLEGDSPRARHWARLQALWSTAQDGVPVAVVDSPPEDESASRLATDIRPQAFAASDALPPCPGPFGGTTVLVLPKQTPSAEVKAWQALEQDDPLARDSRFHRLRVATAEGERSLANVLAKLRSQGRKNVLVIPATFCADSDWMRTLRRSVRDQENQSTIRWLPGLGGRKAALSQSPSPSAEPAIEHALKVHLQPDTHRLVVTDRILLPPTLRRAGAEFTLNSALKIQHSDPPLANIASPKDSEARYTLREAPQEGVFTVSYEGIVDFGLSEQKEQYTRGFRETRGMIGPQGVYLDGDSGWVPKFNDRLIRFTVDVALPQRWQVISQGNGTSRDAQGHAKWDSAGLMEQVYLVGGPLHKESDMAAAVEVAVYLHKRDEALSRKYLDAGARYLEMYRDLIGPYPYSKFALVENFWETGYGMPSFTLLGPQVIRFPFILHSSYPHEILHNWWGNSVFVDYERGNWCEGLTAYLADHLIQEQRGQGDQFRRNTLQKYRDYVRQGRDFPLTKFRSRHSAATEAVGYGKALMTFHMLRRSLGDDTFRAGLRAFYRKQRGRRASFDDLRNSFESVSDKDLTAFFAQWVQRVGAPQLVLKEVTVKDVEQGFLVRGRLEQAQAGEPFLVDVPVVVRTAEGQSTSVVHMQHRSQEFQVPLASRPQSVAVDPMFDVFRQLDPRETPPSIGQIFGEPRILAVLPASSEKPARLDQYRQLMQAWQSDDHAIEFALDTKLRKLPANRAVWMLGRKNRFAQQLFADVEGVTLGQSEATVKLGDAEVALEGHSLVVIRRHPQNIDKAVGWLVVDPEAAFAGMTRKLPHYGKYSYLAFEGDEPTNVVKGQWGTSGSPLVVDLRETRQPPLAPLAAEQRAALAELPPVFSQRSLLEHVRWLSSPQRQGRGLGSEGLQQSAEYIAQAMSEAGLAPGGDKGTWFQRFTVAEGPQGRPVEAVNVVGVLPGIRGQWSDQSIVLSAHYDHLGRGWPDVHAGDEGKIHPGADDNASGVAVMLELARVVASEGGGSRNLVVLACSAEECGRHGSRYYVAHPRFPQEGIRAVINLDTVGRLFDQKLAIHGTGTAEEWPHIFRGCSFVTGVPSQNVAQAMQGSDQMSFIEKGIPGVQIFTGAHGDYHRPSDTADKVDGAGLVKVAAFLKEAVAYLLEREPPLTVRIDGATPQAAPSGGGRRVLFGTVPEFGFQGDGVKIESLVPNSPAARAGLRAGDVLIRLDQQEIADLRAFSEFLKKLKPGQQVEATVLRNGAKRVVRVVVQQR